MIYITPTISISDKQGVRVRIKLWLIIYFNLYDKWLLYLFNGVRATGVVFGLDLYIIVKPKPL